MLREWFPILVFPAFVGLWVGVIYLIALFGGWHALAERYASDASQYSGPRWHMRSGNMRGGARYNNILTIGADSRGLYLSMFFLFRVGHPPLYIPWEHIELRERQSWMFTYVDFTFRTVPGVQLSLPKTLGEQVARAGGRPITVPSTH